MEVQDDPKPGNGSGTNPETLGWGKWFFGITLVAMLVFFWWLLIYDHGVVSAH